MSFIFGVALRRRSSVLLSPRYNNLFSKFINTMTTTKIEPSFTAACCIIGDEILNGKTRESNAYFLSRYLFDMGISLKRVEVIADDYDAIAETVTRLSSQHDVVFTSGGIGPTHDDISYDAIAKAYSLPLQLDNTTCEMMKEMSKDRYPDWTLTEARKRMALFPYPSKILRVDPTLWVPVVVVNDNIHILPGIPRLFEGLIKSLRPYLEDAMAKKQITGKYYRMEIATKMTEGKIASCLSATQALVDEKHIKIGSYPKWSSGPDGERVVVSIVGKDEIAVKETAQSIASVIEGWEYIRKH
ncbi:MoaB/Mog domain-containing protein [Halteromyces radiatus]|uniref:MoaB/Mog domain-containing protein n=1 Tax=Halteromyces radiatus TaxID=101107 RepID=UPI00221ED0CD|nr:MoaB/Mog domain-containing protein [Halteromyces radiatus]KAI8098805.1 MoaB/Mog domain-containing protein [Halteromyces radiatus]